MDSKRIPYSTIRFDGRKLSFMSKYIEECFLRFLTGAKQLEAMELVAEFHRNKCNDFFSEAPPPYELLEQLERAGDVA